MEKRNIFTILFTLTLTIILVSWNKINQKETIKIDNGLIGIIGYGSLLSLKTMEETLKRKYKNPVYRVHLQNFQRVWNKTTSLKDPLFIKIIFR